jgi:hypothetical protein
MSVKLADEKAFLAFDEPALVYVRPMSGTELQRELPFLDNRIMPNAVYFGVRRADGSLVAAHSGRQVAFAEAEAHDFHPVSVH